MTEGNKGEIDESPKQLLISNELRMTSDYTI